MSSLFCKFDIVSITLQDSGPSPPGPLLRRSADGWGQSWDLGDMTIYPYVPSFHTCNGKTTHVQFIFDASYCQQLLPTMTRIHAGILPADGTQTSTWRN